MRSKIFSERSYVWISNLCLFGVVGIAIAYDRLPMSGHEKSGLFWVAMGLGIVSFSAYALRRSYVAKELRNEQRQATPECATEFHSGDVAVPVEQLKPTKPVDVASKVSHMVTKPHALEQIVLLEDLERSFAARQGTLYGDLLVRTLVQTERVKVQELYEQVYLRSASLGALSVTLEIRKVRKNPSKFGKQAPTAHRAVDFMDELYA